MIIPLVSYYQPKVDRKVKSEERGDFPTVADMIGALNDTLQKAPDFAEVPDISDDNEIFMYTASVKLPYKICPETDAKELVYVAHQEKSIIEIIGKHEDPLWKKCVEAIKSWYKPFG